MNPAALMEELLLENVLPFWEKNALDPEHGGYHLNHDKRGRNRGPANKRAVAQFRTLWFFSAMARSPYGKWFHREAADHGFAYIREHLVDREFGGVYWEVHARGGEPADAGKHLYAQAQAVFALAEYARLSQSSEAKATLVDLIACIENHGRDTVHGGFIEAFGRDWTPVQDGKTTVLGSLAGTKLMNTHLHLLEAWLSLDGLIPDEDRRRSVTDLLDLFVRVIVRDDSVSCRRRFTQDWVETGEIQNRQVSYGHDLEAAWLIIEARRVLEGVDDDSLRVPGEIVGNALQHGWDERRGGFYSSGPVGRPASDRSKIWWVQAEALVAFHTLAAVPHADRNYRTEIEKTLSWILRHQADRRHGEWYDRIRPFRGPTGIKAGPWKGPYHTGRALLRCLSILSGERRGIQ